MALYMKGRWAKRFQLIILWMTLAIAPLISSANTLSDADLAKKKTGWYVTGLPLANYSSDGGLGYGFRVYVYNNGEREEEFFDRTPYFVQTYAMFFQTTSGQAYHEVNLDAPYLAKTKWRLGGTVTFVRALNANYFGYGARDADIGLVDNQGNRYADHLAYQDFLDSGSDESSFLKYDRYQYERIFTRWQLSRSLTRSWSVLGGLEVGRTQIGDWSGQNFELGHARLRSAPTRLTEDRDELVGIDGGWANFIILGIKYDTRDFEPNPKEGLLSQFFLEVSPRFLGSKYEYTRHTTSLSAYYTLWQRLTLAGRIAMAYSFGEAPFYETAAMTFFDGRTPALGGYRTGRGHMLTRFMGRGMALGQVELRYFLGDTVLWSQRFGLQPIALIDAGNIYDGFTDLVTKPRFGQYKTSVGGGFAVPWNLSTILQFVTARSSEGAGVSITFGHTF